VVASQGGGLPEAVGPCGILIPNGDVRALAAALKDLLTNAFLREQLVARRSEHLKDFQPEFVAKRYLEFFTSAIEK